jgi:UDP-N-acetyl-D-glucosamine dehydrogenase
MIIAVRHKKFMSMEPDDVVRYAGGPLAIIDCFGILKDEAIGRYFELGCEVKGLGRGHINRIKKQFKR